MICFDSFSNTLVFHAAVPKNFRLADQKQIIFHSFESEMSEVMVETGLVSSEVLLLGLWSASSIIFPLCVCIMSGFFHIKALVT